MRNKLPVQTADFFSNISERNTSWNEQLRYQQTWSTQVPPDTINVDITIRGTSKIRENCTAKYNTLLQTIKDALEKNGLPASNSKTITIQFLDTK